jgi:hypothetical protein
LRRGIRRVARIRDLLELLLGEGRFLAQLFALAADVGDLLLPHAFHFAQATRAFGLFLALALGEVDLFLAALGFLFLLGRRLGRDGGAAHGFLFARVGFRNPFLRDGLRGLRRVLRNRFGLRLFWRRRFLRLGWRRRGARAPAPSRGATAARGASRPTRHSGPRARLRSPGP